MDGDSVFIVDESSGEAYPMTLTVSGSFTLSPYFHSGKFAKWMEGRDLEPLALKLISNISVKCTADCPHCLEPITVHEADTFCPLCGKAVILIEPKDDSDDEQPAPWEFN